MNDVCCVVVTSGAVTLVYPEGSVAAASVKNEESVVKTSDVGIGVGATLPEPYAVEH
jgi:hypothetical protein